MIDRKKLEDACLNYRHDFDLLDAATQANMEHDAIKWLDAWEKTIPEEKQPYTSDQKFGYSVIFMIALLVSCISIATGKVFVMIAGLAFSTVLFIGCFGAAKSERW